MNIFDYAMRMERDGESFYLEMASKTSNQGLKNIFKLLAGQEHRHYEMFDSMKATEPFEMQDSAQLDEIQNIFMSMKDENKEYDMNSPQEEMYKKAQELEKQTEKFYLEQSDLAKENGHKEIFKKIAAEEKLHYWLLNDLIEFIFRSESWLENAEWSHMEEY